MPDKFQEKQLEQEIAEIKEQIQNWEDTDRLYMDSEIKELRHYILYAHTRIESTLGILIGNHIIKPAKETITKDIRMNLMTEFDYFASEMDFAKKVAFAQKNKVIPDSLVGKLFKLNDLRVIFSHPKAYEAKIYEFKDRKKYLAALRIAKAAFDELNKFLTDIYNKAKQQPQE